MKFLVDAHLPPGLCALLRDAGYDALHTRELPAQDQNELLAPARVRELGADPEAVRALPLGWFVALNRLSGGRLSGRVF